MEKIENFIAHRLSSIREADQILVVDEGRIVERGRHNELIDRDGLYRRMWRAHIDADSWTIAAEQVSKVVNE